MCDIIRHHVNLARRRLEQPFRTHIWHSHRCTEPQALSKVRMGLPCAALLSNHGMLRFSSRDMRPMSTPPTNQLGSAKHASSKSPSTRSDCSASIRYRSNRIADVYSRSPLAKGIPIREIYTTPRNFFFRGLDDPPLPPYDVIFPF